VLTQGNIAPLFRLVILKIVEIDTFDFDSPSDPDANIEADQQIRSRHGSRAPSRSQCPPLHGEILVQRRDACVAVGVNAGLNP
jgi:hypothetical protein